MGNACGNSNSPEISEQVTHRSGDQQPDAGANSVKIERGFARGPKYSFSKPLSRNASSDEIDALTTFWPVAMQQRNDFFHNALMRSIKRSPKMNEIFALGHFCVRNDIYLLFLLPSMAFPYMRESRFRDLSKWPKLHRIANGTKAFMSRQIMENLKSPTLIASESRELGKQHAERIRYGFKPQFLDIWMSCCLLGAAKIKIDDVDAKCAFMEGLEKLLRLCTEQMMNGFMDERHTIAFNQIAIESIAEPDGPNENSVAMELKKLEYEEFGDTNAGSHSKQTSSNTKL